MLTCVSSVRVTVPLETPTGRPVTAQLDAVIVSANVPPDIVAVMTSPSSAPSVMLPSSLMESDSTSLLAVRVTPVLVRLPPPVLSMYSVAVHETVTVISVS